MLSTIQIFIVSLMYNKSIYMESEQGAVAPKRTWGSLIFISKFKFL